MGILDAAVLFWRVGGEWRCVRLYGLEAPGPPPARARVPKVPQGALVALAGPRHDTQAKFRLAARQAQAGSIETSS